MRRIPVLERPGWRSKVEAQGLLFHTTDGTTPYWTESAYYEFGESEVLELERTTAELHRMCLEAVQHVIDCDRFDELKISRKTALAIRRVWDLDPPAIYGRFDLAYDGRSPAKLLEFNADTPTSLLEAAVIQWEWLQEVFPRADQFNSIWEGLVQKWRDLKDEPGALADTTVYFAHEESIEDLMTVTLMRDAAQEAGLQTEGIHMGEIGWWEERRLFVDLNERPMRTIFKLYPWEWLLDDAFADHVMETLGPVQWIEPIWKMVLSNKAILAILWEMYPGHPNLLPTFLDGPRDLAEFVRKPILGREGGNVTIHTAQGEVTSDGIYGEEGFVFQAYAPLPNMDGNFPIVGSWVVDCEPRGMGIRESDGPITDNYSRFVPHLFR